MRHKIILLLLVFLIPWTLDPAPSFSAEVKISDLPDGDASIASTDEVPANQSGTTRKLSIGGISDYITTDLNVAFGNPAVNGYCLKSTTLGVRSWGACVTTETDPIIDSITANYLCRGNGAGTLVICDREDNIEASIGQQITEHDDAGGAHATLLLSYATAAQLAAHDADPAPHAGVLVLAEDSVMTGTTDAEVIMADALFNRGFATGDCDDGTVTIDWNISNRYETLDGADRRRTRLR